MTNNPYATPQSKQDTTDHRPRRPVMGIVLGFLFDIGGTIVAAAVAALIYSTILVKQQVPGSDISEAIMQLNDLSLYSAIVNLAGLGFSVAGGYVCLRVSRGDTLRDAVILACILFVFGMATSYQAPNLWSTVGLAVLGSALTLFGGYVALKRRGSAARS